MESGDGFFFFSRSWFWIKRNISDKKEICNGLFEDNDDVVSWRAKERKSGMQSKKKDIGDKREGETRLIFALWYQRNRVVALPIEPTARWKDERRSKGKEQQIEGKADSDRGEWCYWCQCTNESTEKITSVPQVQMNATNLRKNEHSASRGLEGGGEAAEREGGFDPCASVNATLDSLHSGALCRRAHYREDWLEKKREHGGAGWHSLDWFALVDQLENNLGFIYSLYVVGLVFLGKIGFGWNMKAFILWAPPRRLCD